MKASRMKKREIELLTFDEQQQPHFVLFLYLFHNCPSLLLFLFICVYLFLLSPTDIKESIENRGSSYFFNKEVLMETMQHAFILYLIIVKSLFKGSKLNYALRIQNK
jgi:hypothetical protein